MNYYSLHINDNSYFFTETELTNKDRNALIPCILVCSADYSMPVKLTIYKLQKVVNEITDIFAIQDFIRSKTMPDYPLDGDMHDRRYNTRH